MPDIFKEASQKVLRFSTPKGNLTTEQLWKLPLRGDLGTTNLNDIAKHLNKAIRETEEEDFVETSRLTVGAGLDILALEIVKSVIAVKQEEAAKTAAAAERRAQKQRIIELLEQKKDSALSELTVEQLQAQLAAL